MVQEFITFGNTRIKIKNIKQYGIAPYRKIEEFKYYVKVYEHVCKKSESNIFEQVQWKGRLLEITEEKYEELQDGGDLIFALSGLNIDHRGYLVDWNGQIQQNSFALRFDDLIKKKVSERNLHRLYITTYQNDNYEFYEGECNFNIKKKFEELDSLLTK